MVKSHSAKHHAHVDCSIRAKHLATPEVCHVCDRNISKRDAGFDLFHRAARLSCERSTGDCHQSCLTFRKHPRNEIPRMMSGFTSKPNVTFELRIDALRSSPFSTSSLQSSSSSRGCAGCAWMVSCPPHGLASSSLLQQPAADWPIAGPRSPQEIGRAHV